jgi:hypothetical protein
MESNDIEKIILFKEFHPGHERKSTIDTISVHGSAGGYNAVALFKWWRSLSELSDKWSQKKYKSLKNGIGFYHFIIDINGKIFQTFNLDRWFYHAHAGFADSRTIAICLVNTGKKNSHEYTFDQYYALNELIEYLRFKYETIENLDTHDYRAMKYSAMHTPTPCPGPHFKFSELWDHGLEVFKG